MGIIWTIIIGFVAGVIAKLVTPGGGMNPLDSILTTILGIAGAFVASWLGQALGWYGANRRCRRSNNRPADLGGCGSGHQTKSDSKPKSPSRSRSRSGLLFLAGAFSGSLAAAEGGEKLRNERWYEEGVSTITATVIRS